MAITVELELENGEFITAMARSTDSLESFRRQTGQAVVDIKQLQAEGQGLLGTFRDLTVIVGGAAMLFDKMKSVTEGFVGEIIKVNAEMERLGMMLKSMSRAADPIKDAADQMKYLRDFAQTAPFSLNALTSTFVQLKATGIDPTSGAMRGLTEAVAGVGGSEHVLKSAALAISEMSGKGVVEMKELRRQLGQAVPDAMEIMARSMGVTMNTLAKETRSGTIQAKEALEAFWQEVHRVHGMADQRMMDTFIGQTQKMHTQMQNLMLRVGGDTNAEGTFMNALRNQLEDLNRFLAGPVASNLADKLGGALTTGVGLVRSFVESLVGLHNVIIDVGEAWALAFVAKLGVQAFSGFLNVIENVKSGLNVLTQQWRLIKVEMAANQTAFAWATNPVSGRGPSVMEHLAYGASQAGAVLPLVGRAIGMVAPYLPMLAVGVTLAADAFDIFGTKTQKAWEELDKFGATSRKQAEDVSKALLTRLKAERDSLNIVDLQNPDLLAEQKQKALDTKIAQIEERSRQLKEQGGEEGSKIAADKEMQKVRDAMQIAQSAYDQRQRDREKAAKAEEAALNNEGRSTKLVRAKLSEDLKNEMVKVEAEKLAILEASIKKQESLIQYGDTDMIENAKKALGTLAGEWLKQNEALTKAQDAVLSMNKAKKPVDDAKLMERGEQALTKLQAEVVGLKASLGGANAEVYELMELLHRGKFGDIGLDEVKELIEKLMEAKRQQQELNELVSGQKKLEGDITNARAKFLEQQTEAENDGLSEIDKIQARYKAGLYPGLGPNQTEAQKKWQDIAMSIRASTTEAEIAGRTFSDVFNGTAKSGAENFLSTTQLIAKTWGIVAEKITAVGNASNVFAQPTPGAQGFGGTGPNAQKFQPAGQTDIKTEADLVIRTMIGEAANQGEIGMQAVLAVIMNRLKANYNGATSASNVVLQKSQFSVWNKDDPAGKFARGATEDSSIYQKAKAIYEAYLRGELEDPTNGADHYYNPAKAAPGWARNLVNRSRIGAHEFGNEFYQKKYKGDADPYIDPSLPQDQQAEIRDGRHEEQRKNAAQADKAVRDAEKALDEEVSKFTQLSIDPLRKAEAQIVSKIQHFEVDSSDNDPNSPRYKDLIEKARKSDQRREDQEEARRALTEARNAQKQQEKLPAADKIREDSIRTRFNDPDAFRQSERFRNEEVKQNEILEKMKLEYTEDSDAYKQALDRKAEHMRSFTRQVQMEEAQKYVKENEMQQRLFETSEQWELRKTDVEIRQLQRRKEELLAAGEKDVMVIATIEEKIAKLREKNLQSHPITQMITQFGDIGGNLEKSMTSWAGSFNDTLATALMHGKANWRSFADQILKDLTRIGLQLAESQLLKLALNGLGGSDMLGNMFGNLTRLGQAHTGGILGSDSLVQRVVDPFVFAGAPRFHTGGLIGHDEIPIIARKGEGVFTQEQMKALPGLYGKGQGDVHVNIHAPVNATGGSKEQNADLAKQIGTHIESVARDVVVDELRKQMRPGNILNR